MPTRLVRGMPPAKHDSQWLLRPFDANLLGGYGGLSRGSGTQRGSMSFEEAGMLQKDKPSIRPMSTRIQPGCNFANELGQQTAGQWQRIEFWRWSS